jgi:hypothetical protein
MQRFINNIIYLQKGLNMKKIFIILLFTLLIILQNNIVISKDLPNINKIDIDIITQSDKFYVEENINILGDSNISYNEIFIWINDNPEDLKIIFDNNEIEANLIDNNKFSINLSSYNISKNTAVNIKIKYFYNKNENNFRKILFHNTDFLNIKFDDETIFTGLDLSVNSNILIPLYKPSEAPINSYIFIAIFLIVLLSLLSVYYIFRKQKYSKIKNIYGESKELLSTKKILLMSILKQLEKEYRAKKISDDTYNKLRDYYKKEAVDSMKKLEDIESEII